jgi:hypothetical protein
MSYFGIKKRNIYIFTVINTNALEKLNASSFTVTETDVSELSETTVHEIY